MQKRKGKLWRFFSHHSREHTWKKSGKNSTEFFEPVQKDGQNANWFPDFNRLRDNFITCEFVEGVAKNIISL